MEFTAAFTLVSLLFSNFSCLQTAAPVPPAGPPQQTEMPSRACWRRQDWLGVMWSQWRRAARTVWCARTGAWTGCCCLAGMPACATAVCATSSSAPCAGSLCRNPLRSAVRKSQTRTCWKPPEHILARACAEPCVLRVSHNTESVAVTARENAVFLHTCTLWMMWSSSCSAWRALECWLRTQLLRRMQTSGFCQLEDFM